MISLLCPSRGRTEQLGRFCSSAFACATHPEELEVLVYVDSDDPGTAKALRELAVVIGPLRIRGVAGPRMILSETWNQLARVAYGEILGHMGDDIVFGSQAWDEHIVRAFERTPDRICFVHGNDLVHGPALGTHGFLHRHWVNTLGYMVPPYFSHDYNDTWLTEIADALGRHVYLPEVITEHMHPDVGKGVYDQTYLDHHAAGERDGVAALYQRLAPHRQLDIEKLRRAICRHNEDGPVRDDRLR